MNKSNYILITPCKNEELSLPKLIKSLLNQTILPKLWVIVNDGSTDSSRSIMLSYCNKYDWIKILDLPSAPRDSFYRYAEVCRAGFEFVRRLAEQKNIEYQFMGLVDADNILEKLVYEKLIKSLNTNDKLGLVSGGIYYQNGKNIERSQETIGKKELFGTPRLWKEQCFLESGGYQLINAPDVVSSIKCVMNGWDIKQVTDAQAIQTRRTYSSEGLFNGWYRNGASQYIIGIPPFFAFLKSCEPK